MGGNNDKQSTPEQFRAEAETAFAQAHMQKERISAIQEEINSAKEDLEKRQEMFEYALIAANPLAWVIASLTGLGYSALFALSTKRAILGHVRWRDRIKSFVSFAPRPLPTSFPLAIEKKGKNLHASQFFTGLVVSFTTFLIFVPMEILDKESKKMASYCSQYTELEEEYHACTVQLAEWRTMNGWENEKLKKLKEASDKIKKLDDKSVKLKTEMKGMMPKSRFLHLLQKLRQRVENRHAAVEDTMGTEQRRLALAQSRDSFVNLSTWK